MSGRTTQTFQDICARFAPGRFERSRTLALLSAAITQSEAASLKAALELCRRLGIKREQVYETILQAYLFLGFPRMLTAAEALHVVWPPDGTSRPVEPLDPSRTTDWHERGKLLCRTVYGENYEALQARVGAIAPEIFFWMELEGYGKVLSRPGLDPVDRELAIVACLMLENREVQLHSHLRGALNVGAGSDLLGAVLDDLRPLADEGHNTAQALLKKIGATG